MDLQLTFYGAYHSNRVNVAIHIIFVPVLLWYAAGAAPCMEGTNYLLCRTFQVMATRIPLPSAVPTVHHVFNDYLVFDLNVPAIHAALYFLYYLALEPVAAVGETHHCWDQRSYVICAGSLRPPVDPFCAYCNCLRPKRSQCNPGRPSSCWIVDRPVRRPRSGGKACPCFAR